MGFRLVKFAFTPGEHEQIETVVRLPEEPRSVIHGVVRDYCDRIVKDAVVNLFRLENPHDPCSLVPLTHTFTDECGHFLFGPLCSNAKYVIKVWVDDVKIKELVVRPNYSPCDNLPEKVGAGFEEEEK